MLEVLNALNTHLSEHLKLNYEFGQMSESPPKYPYWVGDYTETESLTEDGVEYPTIILSGFARGNFIEFEEQKERIKEYFKFGTSDLMTVTLPDQTTSKVSVNIWFNSSTNIPDDNLDLKRCQIYLNTKIWKGYE
jgi:hypothetical protein